MYTDVRRPLEVHNANTVNLCRSIRMQGRDAGRGIQVDWADGRGYYAGQGGGGESFEIPIALIGA